MTNSKVFPSKKVRSVAVIGGGVSGAIALDTLKQENSFDKITVFERRDKLGGTWIVDEKPETLAVVPGISHTVSDPHVEPPVFHESDTEVLKPRIDQHRHVFTPSYVGMRTKTPERLMTFSDQPRWSKLDKPKLDYFTTTDVVNHYIQTYFDKYPLNITLNTTIEKLEKDLTTNQFKLYLRTETDKKDGDGNLLDSWTTQTFDAVIIATGYYHVPFIPEVPGIHQVMAKYPEVITHSKIFTNTHESLLKYQDKTVLVIGARPSSHDLGKFISPFAKRVYQSYRTLTDFIFETEKIKLVPNISSYELTPSGFVVNLIDGQSLQDIDYIIYGTGYKISYPFLNETYPEFTTGTMNPTLYQHIFHIDDPLLSVIGTPIDAINFKTLEYQSILISRFLAGKVGLPPIEEQTDWLKERFSQFGDSRKYHVIGMFQAIEFGELLTDLGGGRIPAIGDGKAFPIITQDDIDHYVEEKKKFQLDY